MHDFETLDAGPFLDHAGPLLRIADGAIGLRIEQRHLNAAGKAHGGLLASIADHAIGRAVNEALEDAGAVTVSLTTDYLGEPSSPSSPDQPCPSVHKLARNQRS